MPTTETSFAVPDISCERCETAVHDALSGLNGVCGVAVDLTGKVVTVKHATAVDAEVLAEAISAAGYHVSGYEAG